jgi:hypothetical protein
MRESATLAYLELHPIPLDTVKNNRFSQIRNKEYDNGIVQYRI